MEKNKREMDDNVTFPPPLGPTRATFEPGFSFNVIPCNSNSVIRFQSWSSKIVKSWLTMVMLIEKLNSPKKNVCSILNCSKVGLNKYHSLPWAMPIYVLVKSQILNNLQADKIAGLNYKRFIFYFPHVLMLLFFIFIHLQILKRRTH